jgi:HD-GYP domain-containing protein (c-di-GMP phosphodiesterase class II)
MPRAHQSRLGVMENDSAYVTDSSNGLEETLQAFSDLNLVLDTSGVILEYQPGYFFPVRQPGIAVGQKMQDVFSIPITEKFEQAFQQVMRSGHIGSFEYQLTISDRVHWFDARLVPSAEGRVIFTARDITKCRETENKMKQQMQQLSMLRSIDLAIASGLDLNLLLAMLLDQLTLLTEIDAVAILLLNPKTNILEFTAGQGFRSNSLQYTHLRLGEGCAGRVALDRKMLNIPNLKENRMDFGRSPFFEAEDFVVYYGVPMIAKGRVLGVLEMFHRSTLQPDADWLNFLNMIAGQAAIAVDSARMFRDLQKTNVELSMAYDATIEGLSRALDLRDKETEEHTQRVSETTVKLAAQFGVADANLVHIRRGAILHDIGKVAIPDRILFKPGPLAEDEWKIMRRHPGIAVDLLSSVSYLTPALEIPHWHHEKWDGTGYPDHLKGETIPYSARLFALVDVYDALTSNRPYRGAWSKQDTLRYIESQAGKHFDPTMVPRFVHFMHDHPI